MVGTAVYQVGPSSLSQPGMRAAEKPSVQITEAPLLSDDISAPISPWMWKSGITLRQRSEAPSSRLAAMLAAEATRLRWRSGTSFGFDVVPEVGRMRATSDSLGGATAE